MEFGLSSYINATKRKVIWEIHEYLKVFRQTFYKHCSCETEINIKEQNIDDEGWRRINLLKVESESLDFKKNLDFILNKWILAMNGQPQPYREIPISTLMKREIFEKVHNFIASLQEETLREKKENLECNKNAQRALKSSILRSINWTKKLLNNFGMDSGMFHILKKVGQLLKLGLKMR